MTTELIFNYNNSVNMLLLQTLQRDNFQSEWYG